MAEEAEDRDVSHAPEEGNESVTEQAEREEREGQLDGEGNAVESGEQGSQDDGEDAAAKRKERVQKRIDQLTKQRYEAERRARELEEENRKLKSERSAEPPKDDPRPDFDTYDSVAQYQHDIEAWARRQAQRESQAQPSEPEGPSVDVQQAIDRIENAALDAADRYPDFDQVVRDPSLPLNDEMLVAASDTNNVADVLYHLGKNPEEARRLSQLQGSSLVREMGRLEARLERPSESQGTQQSRAPEPIRTVGGSRAKREPKVSEMSTEEFIAYRNRQEQEKRKQRR